MKLLEQKNEGGEEDKENEDFVEELIIEHLDKKLAEKTLQLKPSEPKINEGDKT